MRKLPFITIPAHKKNVITSLARGYFWFICGAIIGLFFFVSFIYIYYKRTYADAVYPGVSVNGVEFGGKSRQEVYDYFAKKNDTIQKSVFLFTVGDQVATVSARELDFGYDEELLADQAYSIGRASNAIANVSLMMQGYMQGITLSAAYRYDEDVLGEKLEFIRRSIYVEPVDARFSFEDGRVKEFKTSSDGKEVDIPSLKKKISSKTLAIVAADRPQTLTIPIPVKILKPRTTTEEVNDMGIKELVATGTSRFAGSIPNRMYNIALAASRLNGVLIKPNEVFSFNKAVGDISTLTGYKQAYVIQNGRTVLGDGGGVCQVSTTFFRAVLNAGLPVVERNAHAYRVSYYEQDSGPGIDAAIYVPTVDFKFKNDTKHYLLVQTSIDPDNAILTFNLYGTADNREVVISKPVILSTSSSPEPLYIDDPTLPKGEMKQIDYAVGGASVYFTRTVKKDGEVIINDKFSSFYRPWQAVYLKGTKEG